MFLTCPVSASPRTFSAQSSHDEGTSVLLWEKLLLGLRPGSAVSHILTTFPSCLVPTLRGHKVPIGSDDSLTLLGKPGSRTGF